MQKTTAFSISALGPRAIQSPLHFSSTRGDSLANFVEDDETVRWMSVSYARDPEADIIELEKAGPRELLYFNPAHVHAGIATCGGLCPGLNDVIRALVRSLWNRYGVRRISGIRFGYKGFLPEYSLPIMPLDPGTVDDIHKIGGTLPGSSRGEGTRTAEIVDAIERLKVAVIGIPKTIDNDLLYIDRSFGFETAVEKASEAVIVVAEGAGQELLEGEDGSDGSAVDASRNLKLGDIGMYLKERIMAHFKAKNLEVNLKYIDPSYMIQSAPACPTDSVYCERLVNNEFVHLPTAMVVSNRNRVEPEGSLYRDALDSTGQALSLVT